jgi:hypothetical protein
MFFNSKMYLRIMILIFPKTIVNSFRYVNFGALHLIFYGFIFSTKISLLRSSTILSALVFDLENIGRLNSGAEHRPFGRL